MRNLLLLMSLTFSVFLFGQVPTSAPLFPNSVVSNDIDFIKSTDEDGLLTVAFSKREDKEMPDSRNDNLFDKQTFIFQAKFKDNTIVEIWCHSSFGTQTAAKGYADKLAPRLGKLPTVMRQKVDHVVVHKGDATAFGEIDFFVLYSENMDVRISNNDLEETVFHESTHASLDVTHAKSTAWKNAQIADVNFVTTYAKENAVVEDLAETNLFAYTVLKYPGRLPANVESWVKTHIPNRLNYIKTKIFPNLLTGAEVIQEAEGFMVFPNPSDDGVFYLSKSVSWELSNNQGQLIEQGEGNLLDLAAQTRGVFFLKTIDGQFFKLVY